MQTQGMGIYIPILILMTLAVLIVLGGHAVSLILSPKRQGDNTLQETPYECGEIPLGTAWSMFNVRFYVVGLIFIIFDVESSLLFPVAAVFKKLNELGFGGIVLVEIFIFVLVLAVGIAYCWRKGDLDWVKSYVTLHPNNTNSNNKS